MMVYLHSKQSSFTLYLPMQFTNHVYHKRHGFVNKGIEAMPSKTGSLNIRYVFERLQFSTWTVPKQHKVNPLISYFFLNVKSKIIHPTQSRAAALDQGIYDYIFFGFPPNICPSGNTGRALLDTLVERIRFDCACKARLAYRWRTLKLFIAGAMQALHGSFVFYWGKKSARILALLSQIENRTNHICAGAQLLLFSAWAEHSSKKPLRLNALRVAERNFTCEAT